MTDPRNRQIAEGVMGWEIRPRPWRALTIEDSKPFQVMIDDDNKWRWRDQCSQREDGTWEVPESAPFAANAPPDYLHDKNACHEALEKMREGGWRVLWIAPRNKDDNEVVNLWNGADLFKAFAPTFEEAAVDAMLAALSPPDETTP